MCCAVVIYVPSAAARGDDGLVPACEVFVVFVWPQVTARSTEVTFKYFILKKPATTSTKTLAHL